MSLAPDAQAIARLREAASRLVGLPAEPWKTSPLCEEGSQRFFFRLRQGACSFVGLVSPRAKATGTDENDSYLLIGRHLARCGLPVPRILAGDPREGWLLLEDLGDRHLQWLALRGSTNLSRLYARAIGILGKMHREAPRDFDPSMCFDTPRYDPPFVYERELEYFRKCFLASTLGLEIDEEDLRPDFERLAEEAGVWEGNRIIHRDFQSRNLMVRAGKLWIIDFQGMRWGPPAYDLASLLLDPYVRLPACLQKNLLDLYWRENRRFLGLAREGFLGSYKAVRLCRNLQVLGAYGRLGVEMGKVGFLKYIPGAWSRLSGWLEGPRGNRYPRLKKQVRRINVPGSSLFSLKRRSKIPSGNDIAGTFSSKL